VSIGAPCSRNSNKHGAVHDRGEAYRREHEVGVIVRGAVGPSAALGLTHARLRVAVVDEGQPRHPPRLAHATFLGSDGQAPTGLVAAEREDIAECGEHGAHQSDSGHQVLSDRAHAAAITGVRNEVLGQHSRSSL
jgi:hypothetical protein